MRAVDAVQNSTFIFHTPPTIRDRRIVHYDPGRLRQADAGSQVTDLSCDVPTSTFCCTV